jgi:hypothetical protein
MIRRVFLWAQLAILILAWLYLWPNCVVIHFCSASCRHMGSQVDSLFCGVPVPARTHVLYLTSTVAVALPLASALSVFSITPGPAPSLRRIECTQEEKTLGVSWRLEGGQTGAARSNQKQPGAASSSQEQPGAARDSQEQAGAVRISLEQQGVVGMAWSSPEPGASRKHRGAARRSQEQPGAARRGQEQPGSARSSQKQPGDIQEVARSSQEQPRAASSRQEQ